MSASQACLQGHGLCYSCQLRSSAVYLSRYIPFDMLKDESGEVNYNCFFTIIFTPSLFGIDTLYLMKGHL